MPATYEVVSGDTLSAIANRHNATVTRLLRLNPAIENPDRIYPGQELTVPESDEVITACSEPGKTVDQSPCQDEIVEIYHATGSGELILLTKDEEAELESEEKAVCGLIEKYYADLENLSEGEEDASNTPLEGEGQVLTPVQQRKQEIVDHLAELGVIPDGVQSTPRLTEIKRLSGKKHRTFVRSDKMKFHKRRYSIAARDRARSEGWLTDDGVDGKKLADSLRGEFKANLKVDLISPDPNGATMQALNHFYDEASWSIWGRNRDKQVAETGFDASAEAQFMRFAAGLSAHAEINPANGKVHLQAKAEAQYALAEGKVTIEQAFPASNRSEIRVYYREGGWNGPLKHVSLGKFQAALVVTASGFAGASAIVAANIHVDSSEGLPKIKGIAARKKGQSMGGEGSVFAGIRGGCELAGELRWKDVLSTNKEWDILCKIGQKVEAALGAAAEFEARLMFSDQTGKFYFNLHAGLVLGVGAAGSFLLEVGVNQIFKMIHFIYNALLEVDFRYLELFDGRTNAFWWYQQMTLFALAKGITGVQAATDFATETVRYIEDFLDEFFSGRQLEKKGAQMAENVLSDLDKGEEAIFLHSPPEVKGVVLDLLLYDWWVTPGFVDESDKKVKAVSEILKTFQSWRDFEETVARMNSKGSAKPNELEDNLERLFSFVGKTKAERNLFIQQLKGRVAIAGRPVKLDPFGVCRVCGIA
jgi:LysM repeat protein